MTSKLIYGLAATLLITACEGSDSKKNTPPAGSSDPDNVSPLVSNDCSSEPWDLALAGLVVNDQATLGQDGSGLPPTEQTWALLQGFEEYATFRFDRAVQRRLQTVTQFSSGYPRSSTTIHVKGQRPEIVEGCKTLADLLRGKSLIKKDGEPDSYRIFAFKHDFFEAIGPVFDELPSLRRGRDWNRDAALFKEGVEVTPKSMIMDVRYRSKSDPTFQEIPTILDSARFPAEFSCQKPFKVKASTLRIKSEELKNIPIDANHCSEPQLIADTNYQDCAFLKVEHTIDSCTFSVKDAEVLGESGAFIKVSFSGRMEALPDITQSRGAPFYTTIIDKIRIEP